MPSLVDHGDGSFSVASSVSKQSELLPQKLQFNNSADSTDVSTNPSITGDGNPAEQVAAVSTQKKKKKKSMFTRMKTPFRGTKTQHQKEYVKKLPHHQASHTLHAPDDWGNVECYVLDARAIRVEEQEKNKSLRPVGLVSDDCGNVECRALEKGSGRIEEMEPKVAHLVSKPSVEEQQCNMKQLRTQICMQPSSDTAMFAGCNKGTVDCSFYDQIYAQLMGSPSDLNEPIACIGEENLNLPDPKDIVDGIKKEVQGGLKHLDNTLDCVVSNIFPVREDISTIQGLAITHSETEIELEHSFTQAEI